LAERLTFIGVEIFGFSRTKKKGTVVHLGCELSGPVMEKMGWADAPACYKGGSLEGDIAAVSAEILPSDRTLSRHAIELDASRLKSFTIVRLEQEGKRGAGKRTELRFELISGDLKGARKVEEYIMVAGKSQLKISYEKPVTPEQEALEGADTGCVACNAGIPLQPDNPKKHETGVKCTARPVQTQMEGVQ
jgi:hypothetical protein